jgi:hypothetical protein
LGCFFYQQSFSHAVTILLLFIITLIESGYSFTIPVFNSRHIFQLQINHRQMTQEGGINMIQNPLKALGLIPTMLLTVLSVMCFIVPSAYAEQSGTFKGSWIATGKRQAINFSKGRKVYTFKLTGHVNLTDDVGKVADFWSECVGLWDSETGGSARCVWQGLEGQEAYLVLNGQLLKERVQVTGEFVGGSGELTGLTGSINFTWTRVFFNPDQGTQTGHTEDLAGTYRIP